MNSFSSVFSSLQVLLLLLNMLVVIAAFQHSVASVNYLLQPIFPLISRPVHSSALSSSSSNDSSLSGGKEQAKFTVESVLKDNYPEFHSLLSKNEGLFKTLDTDFSDGYTIFAPNSQAFVDLSEKQRKQLEDPRNLETAQKMGLYHVVTEALSITNLNTEDWTVPKTPEGLPALKFAAVKTLGGEVPIGRFKKKTGGGFWRSLVNVEKTVRDKDGKPVTEIVVGPAGTILRSVKVGNAMIHEVDSLVSPVLLWRYCDQLRMPGF